MTFGSRSVFLRLMRVFLLEMDLLLPYEYTSHCTEPLSNRVGQDHHWISFCPWAITVPSVDRLSKMTSLKVAQIQGCVSFRFYTCFLAEQEYLSEDLPHPAL